MKKGSLLALFLTVFIDLLGFGMVVPFMAFYAQRYGAKGWQVGFVLAIYSLMQFLFSPVWGRLSDRIGRRPVLLISLTGSIVGYALFAFAHSLTLLFVSRMVAGIAGANIGTAQAYVADTTTPENRSKGMGLIGAAFGMGFILGPPMSGLLSKLGTQHGFHENFAPGVVASFLSVCAFLVCLTSLPESKPPDLQPRSKIPPHLDRRMWSYIFEHRAIALILSSLFLIILSFAGMEPTVALFGADRFNFSPLDLGKFFGFMGVIVAVIQGGLIGRITRMVGERTTVIIGAVSLTLGLLIVPSVYRVALLYPSALLIAVGQGLCYPSLSSLLSQVSPREQVGSMMGISSALASLSRVIGPLYAGWLYDRWRAPGAFYGESLVVFLGLLLAIALRMQKIEYAEEKAVEPVEIV